MDKMLEQYDRSSEIQDGVSIMKSSTMKRFEFVLKSLPTEKIPCPVVYRRLLKTFKEINLIRHNSSETERGLDSGPPHPDTAPRALGRELRASGAAQPAGMRREGGGRRTKPVRTGTDPRAELSRTSPPVHGRSRPRGWRVNALSGRATQEDA